MSPRCIWTAGIEPQPTNTKYAFPTNLVQGGDNGDGCLRIQLGVRRCCREVQREGRAGKEGMADAFIFSDGEERVTSQRAYVAIFCRVNS